jgi:hypothetical protein
LHITTPYLERRDNVDELVRVVLVDLDVKGIDAAKLLEEHSLALHHRLGRCRTDVSEAQDSRPIADHADEMAAGCVFVREVGVVLDREAWLRDAGRVCDRQTVLAGCMVDG